MRRIVYGENERVGKWIQEHDGGYYRAESQCIGLERDGELIAGVMYDWHNDASIYMHVASGPKRWMDRSYLRAVFAYPFIQLKCNVIIGLVAEDNFSARRFDEHIGFTLEHRIKGADPAGDLLIYTMRPEQCRWLK